jgi:hypothetical protein
MNHQEALAQFEAAREQAQTAYAEGREADAQAAEARLEELTVPAWSGEGAPEPQQEAEAG